MMLLKYYWHYLSPGKIYVYSSVSTPHRLIWTVVEPTLAAHIRDFARNIKLLRKSKEDCRADAKLRERSNQAVDEVDEESYR